MVEAEAGSVLDIDREIALGHAEIQAGAPDAAASRFRRLIDEPIYDARLHYALSAALGASGDAEAAASALLDAQTFHAHQEIVERGGDLNRIVADPNYAIAVGDQFYAQKLMGPASAAYAHAVKPGVTAQALLRWGLSLQHQGRMEEAVTAFTLATESAHSPGVHQFLLYACFFSEDGVRRHAEEVRRWAELYAPEPPARSFPNRKLKGRPLKVGYVAPGFRDLQLRQFILPVLENHDPERVEVVLYAMDAAREEGVPARTVRSLGGLSAEQAAAVVLQDKIDILVDLWGHTANGRLDMFALRPAPVQVAWLNYVQSTGLRTMDYVIHSDATTEAADEAFFTEKIWRIGPVAAPFRIDRRAPETRTPALRNGYVTFGSFNHPARLNDGTVAAWSRILKASPGSRLVLKYGFFLDPVLQSATLSRFAARGVSSEAIEFRGHTAGEAYLGEFADIDLALDPSPCPGGTTSSEAIANGVPLVTLRGADFYSRIGVLRLAPLGLDDLITHDWDGYVAKALEITRDPVRLNALRLSLRERYDTSAIRDEAGFTRRLEAAFAEMYERWFKGA